MTSIKSRETCISRLAKRCGLELEKTREPDQYEGWPYILWDSTGRAVLYADHPDDLETYMRERFPKRMPRKNKDWADILAVAAEIVDSYDDIGVTLRQLFYQLVVRRLIENNISRYSYLSSITAEGRRTGDFPDLIDQGSSILVRGGYSSPLSAIQSLANTYRRDHTEGQAVSLYLAVEKAAIKGQLWSWFGADLGLPILALGGYASQSYVGDIKRDVESGGRDSVLIYAGDHDASGDDIYRDFVERTGCWVATHRIALTKEQARNLPRSISDKDDSRQPAFNKAHGYPPGSKIQVELDALTPDVLRGLYQDVVDQYWDDDAYEAVLAREDEERDQLQRVKLPKPRPTSG